MHRPGDIIISGEREYTVKELIGRGANTAAYLAVCKQGELVSKCILKEYAPQEVELTEEGKARFLASGKIQNDIRQLNSLCNRTPPVSHIFEANGTAYIDVVCFGGRTLDKLALTLPQYAKICQSIALTAGYYHKAGFLCLDLKPSNIFIMQDSPDETVTQLAEFIDFDSVRRIDELQAGGAFSYTREWSAPEQLAHYPSRSITAAADIYTLGEIVFFLLFDRHSEDSERRGFSKYPFDEVRKDFKRYTDRPDIRALFTRLFRGTLRSSAANRFKSADDVVKILDSIIRELDRRDYIIPKMPSLTPNFVGRERELKAIEKALAENRVLFLTGVGGIGKSTLAKAYIRRTRENCEALIYLEFDGDILHTFCDDMQLQLSTVSRLDTESLEEYFRRKLKALRSICGEKKVLLVIDNFSGRITKEMSVLFDCGYDTVVITRNRPPLNSFALLELGPIEDRQELFRLIVLNLGRQPSKDERTAFEEIISLVQGHTLVLELIARQIAAGRLDVRTALSLIREHGLSHFSNEKIGSYKDGEEVYDTLAALISALFDAGKMTPDELKTMKMLALLDVRGLEAELVKPLLKLDESIIKDLGQQGWLCDGERIRLHPVIAEAMRGHEWSEASEDNVMEYHKQVCDIYTGMANAEHIREVVREADRFSDEHPTDFNFALYYDILGTYYDTLLDGAYIPCSEEEEELLAKLVGSVELAIESMENSDDPRRDKYLIQYYLSLASILIRSTSDGFDEAAEYLDKAQALLGNEPSPEHCYFLMTQAWYHTLAEPDPDKVRFLTAKACQLAKTQFPTELERIDIIHIPTANCLYYLGELKASAEELEKAAAFCRSCPDPLPYADKLAELLRCELDVYSELGDTQKCRALLAELDGINEKYKDQGVFREVSPDIRKKIENAGP